MNDQSTHTPAHSTGDTDEETTATGLGPDPDHAKLEGAIELLPDDDEDDLSSEDTDDDR